MDDVKQAGREVETNAKKAARGIDGESTSDKVANAGDEIRKDLGNAGDDIRNAVDKTADQMDRPRSDPANDRVAPLTPPRPAGAPGATRGAPVFRAPQPPATIRPARIVATAAGSQLGRGRWVRTSVVRPAITGSSADHSRASVATSRSAVGSSSTRIGASRTSARAIARRRARHH